MATPFVPVPVPMQRAPRADSERERAADRCPSPVTRARLSGTQRSVEYSSHPLPETPGQSWDERPITPTVLGYEVMEERAKFTVSPSDLTSVQQDLLSSYRDSPLQQDPGLSV